MKAIILLCLIASSFAIIKVNPANQFFVDEYGRVRIFHGVNAVYKIPPWIPQTSGFDPINSLSEIDAQNLQSWGFNAVRLGVMWPGVEPAEGYYNTTYLNVVQEIVQTLANYGIYTLIDFHQDVLNRKFCGEGIPDWAVYNDLLTLPFALPVAEAFEVDSNDYPPLEKCLEHIFGRYYFAQKTANAFQNFYDNTNGFQDRFVAYWSLLSQTFNETDSILGYELINEPWAGDMYEEPELLEPGIADQVNLQPLYTRLHLAIRENDNDHIIFFEKALVDIANPSGFTEGPGGPEYNDRQVYSYHVYCGTDSFGNVQNVIECEFEEDFSEVLDIADIKRLGCGSMMTEFGAEVNTTLDITDIQYVTAMADHYIQSWTYWQFKWYHDITTAGSGEAFYDNEGNFEMNKVKALSRTYAQAISGVPTLMSFDPQSSAFQLVYNMNTTIQYPTVIYLNEAWYYPDGYSVQLIPSSAAIWKSGGKNNVLISPASGTPNGQTLSVIITAN